MSMFQRDTRTSCSTERRAFVGYDDSTKEYRVYLPHKCAVTVTCDIDFNESWVYKGDITAPQFDVEKLMELRLTYSIPKYPEVVHNYLFEKRQSSTLPQETWPITIPRDENGGIQTTAEYSDSGNCKTTPKATMLCEHYHDGVVENHERVNYSTTLLTPNEATPHDSSGTNTQGDVSPILSWPTSTFQDRSFTTSNSARFLSSIFSTQMVALSFASKNFCMQGHDT